MTDTTVDLPVVTTEDTQIAVTLDTKQAKQAKAPVVSADEGIESLKEQVAEKNAKLKSQL